jgi:hypothetical protein
MSAGAGRHQDQSIGALLDRLVRELLVDDVVEDDAAPAMRRLLSSSRAPSEVIIIGTLCFSQSARS